MSEQKTTPTPEERQKNVAKVMELATKLSDTAMQSGDHALALDGLLSAFCAIAEVNPCCTQHSANALMYCAMQLAQKVAQTRPQPGQHIH